MNITELSKAELAGLCADLEKQYEGLKAHDHKLDMSRGKPSAEQLDLSNDLLTDPFPYISANGTDSRNYGVLEGLPEIREFFGDILGIDPNNIIIGGNASLSLEYDALMRMWVFGSKGATPWSKLPKVKFICPVPGYDRHFTMLEELGIEMINVDLYDDGPDMDKVEELVKYDPSVKGIFCVPLYSNPTGACYSDEKTERLAAMKTAAEDFKIFWDNAYGIHHLYDEGEKLANILDLCEKHGNADRVFYFFSTSKITFAGAGVSLVAASADMIKEIRGHMFCQTIGYDKTNQLRTLNFFKTHGGIEEHMKRHAAILRPKFELVLNRFESEFAGSGILSWSKPKGGYFISVNTLKGCAKETVALCKGVGLTLTGAGAAFPYKKDPDDSNIRIAPSYPDMKELADALDVFCICCRLAAVRKLLEN